MNGQTFSQDPRKCQEKAPSMAVVEGNDKVNLIHWRD